MDNDNQRETTRGRWKARARLVLPLLLLTYIGGYYALTNGLLIAPHLATVRVGPVRLFSMDEADGLVIVPRMCGDALLIRFDWDPTRFNKFVTDFFVPANWLDATIRGVLGIRPR